MKQLDPTGQGYQDGRTNVMFDLVPNKASSDIFTGCSSHDGSTCSTQKKHAHTHIHLNDFVRISGHQTLKVFFQGFFIDTSTVVPFPCHVLLDAHIEETKRVWVDHQNLVKPVTIDIYRLMGCVFVYIIF